VYDFLRPWSLRHKQLFGNDGFIPFDVTPLGYLTHPQYFKYYENIPVDIVNMENDATIPANRPKEKAFFDQKMTSLIDQIKSSSPDVICLQEVDFESARSFDINQATDLAKKANYPYVAPAVGWSSNYIPFPYWPIKRNFGRVKSGGVILSKYPIISHAIHFYQKPTSKPWWYNLFYPHRYFQKVEIEFGEKKIKVIGLHLDAYDKQDRRNQISYLVESIKTDPVDFIVGDFNMLPDIATKRSKFITNSDEYENDPSFSEMKKSGMAEVIPEDIYIQDETAYMTFPASKPERRLDYIFFNPSLKMIKAEILPSALSDHLPLRASFQISNPKFNPYSQ
jgi:endonuclease/exonuclease/phosphatase family metal-dependent hydrolase